MSQLHFRHIESRPVKIDRAKLQKVATIKLIREDEDSHFTDGHFDDAETVVWINEQLSRGNEWAWCVAHVTATYGGLKGEDYLGGCSYESEANFRADGYFESMVDDALEELAKALEAIANAHIWEHDETTCLFCVVEAA
jgi:hypothetical protein